ncbi:MAG TPA: HAD hydrolase family protein [Candidatus Cloacimonadota bacterium]|nr:HAD hydrolase family protein [Candidatus Cloacimonadota bacterium]
MERVIKPPVDWQSVQLVIFDCDGVLTDGKMIYGPSDTLHPMEIKNFNAHDGLGFTLLHQAGLLMAIITGRYSSALKYRCNILKIKYLYQNVEHKLKKAEELLTKLNLSWQQAVYMGDDYNDVPCMQMSAFSVCPADAVLEVQKIADMVTSKKGGDGAARELIDFILKKKGLYEQAVDAYLQSISS